MSADLAAGRRGRRHTAGAPPHILIRRAPADSLERPHRLVPLPMPRRRRDLRIEAGQSIRPLVELEHVAVCRRRVYEVELRASDRTRAHGDLITMPDQRVRDVMEVVDNEGQVMQAGLVRPVHVANWTLTPPVVDDQLDHQRTPLAVRGTVVEGAGTTSVHDVDELDVTTHEEGTGTEITAPRVSRRLHVGDEVGDLNRRAQKCTQPVHRAHAPMPSDFARVPLSWKSAS